MLRRFFDWWRGADLAEPEGPVTPQSGAVPYRMTDKGVRFAAPDAGCFPRAG
ncbi:MAG: hypothetical protein ACOY4G_07815 [Pseudomonadota bacterium]